MLGHEFAFGKSSEEDSAYALTLRLGSKATVSQTRRTVHVESLWRNAHISDGRG